MLDSTARRSTRKQSVRARTDWRKSWGLSPDFPLFPLGNPDEPKRLRWAKKVRGKLHYFGKVDGDPKGQRALEAWLRDKDNLIAGRTPRAAGDGLTMADLCNRFLTVKAQLRDLGEITPRHWANYKRTTDKLIGQFGKTRLVSDLAADDFEALRHTLSQGITKRIGPVALGNEIQHCRIVFKYAWDAGLIPQPVRFGPMFKRPSKKVLRLARDKGGRKLFSAGDVQAMLKASGRQLKAMILIGLNCGYGNQDVGTLPMSALDLAGGYVNYGRPKTGVKRRCPLWKETVKALREVLAKRRVSKHPDHAELVFITKYGGSFAKETSDSPVAKEFAKLLKALGLTQRGRGFYSLRHTFRTIAAGAKDLEATRAIMGHTSGHVEETYIETLPDDARLKAVVNHVRKWLNAKPAKGVNRG